MYTVQNAKQLVCAAVSALTMQNTTPTTLVEI